MRFSVIIPLYHKAPYVAKAIQSVLSQTFTDYELVIVDDGSKDESAEIAAKSIEGYGNCCLIRQENQGVSIARNNGVAASHGDYLCFLDADDWWAPTFLEEMSRLIENYTEAGIYGTNYTIVNETKRKTRVAKIGVEDEFEKGYINYCQAYAKTLYMPLTSISVAIPRKIFDEMHGFPEGIKLGEDFLLWIRIALKYKVVFLNKPLAYYNQDVDLKNRGVGKLYPAREHFLWNVSVFEPVEKENEDYKCLIDTLRVTGLLRYYLAKEYRKTALEELQKVNWGRQTKKMRRLYRQPMWCLSIMMHWLEIGSKMKKALLKYV